MAYWDGDYVTRLTKEQDTLRERFKPSRLFLDRMEALYDRSKAARIHPIQGMLPNRVLNDTDKAQMARTLYTSNHIEQMVHSSLNRMERSEIIVNVAIAARDQAEGERQDLLEQLCQGILSRQTRRTVEEHRSTTFIRRMSGYAFRRASVAQRINVTKDARGKVEIAWDLYDPYNTYFDFGSKPRRFFYDHYERKDAMLARLGRMGLPVPRGKQWEDAKDSDMVCMTDYLLEHEENGRVRVDGVITVEGWPVREPTDMDFGRMPVSVICMNNGDLEPNVDIYSSYKGTGGVPDQYIARMREPIYSSLEETIPQLENLLSLEMLGEMFRVAPPRKVKKVGDGADTVAWEYELWGPDSTVIMPDGWDIEMMQMNSQPGNPQGSRGELLAQIERVFPSVLWSASTGANESGWHLYQRIDQGKNAIVGPVLGVAFALQAGLEEVLYQWRRSGDAEMDLRVKEDPDVERYELKTFRAKDLPEHGYELSITVPPELPTDPMAQAQLYQSVITSGAMDEWTAQAKVMLAQNPDGVIKRKLQDAVRNSQEKINEAILKDKWETFEALKDAAARETDKQARFELLKQAKRAEMSATAFEQQITGNPLTGYTDAAQAGKPSPRVQPPEARGAENPSAQRARAGITPPGGRPAQAVQDGGF